MILSGKIENGRAIIPVEIEGTSAFTKVPVLLDTGFNGELMLASQTIASLGLNYEGTEGFFVATGDYVNTNFFSAFVHWFGKRRLTGVLATEGNQSLLGMDLLADCLITINVPDRVVEINKT